MSTDDSTPSPPAWPARATAASVVLLVVSWLGLVLAHQYGFQAFSRHALGFDGLFLLGVAGIVLTRSVARWGAAAVAGVVLRLAFSAAVLTAGLGVIEVAMRRMMPTAMHPPTPAESDNALGFREREIGAKVPGRYRIVVIGDSFTYGNGVEVPERFSDLLESFLGPRYEVLNFGRPGANLADHLERLKLAMSVEPDFVLLQLYENDFETPEMVIRRPRSFPLLPAGLDDSIERYSLLYRLLVDYWNQIQNATGLTEGYVHYMERHLLDPQTSDSIRTSGMLLQFIAHAKDAGIPNGAVLFPALYGLEGHGAHYPFGFLHERVRKHYEDAQTPFLDLLSTFAPVSQPQSLWVTRFDPHPNAKANRLAAVAIQNRFLPVWVH